MRKFSNLQNTIYLSGTLMVLLFTWWSRTGLMPLLNVYNYLSIFSLAATIFILPDFVVYYFPGKNRWFETGEFYTIVLIIFLGITGLVMGPYAEFVNYILLPAGIGLAFWEFFRFLKLNNKMLNLLSGATFMGFMVLLFYSQWFHTPVYPEVIILGQGFDQLFHSSISNMFSTVGYATTGLDGVPYFNYHWGSHILFAGFKNFTGVNTIMFYNIVYPAIFIPLFFKSLFCFFQRLLSFKNFKTANVILIISFITLLYSLGFGNMTGIQAMPMVIESLNLSLIFTFLYGSVLFSYISKAKNNHIDNSFFIYSVIILLIISFLKISTGFVLVIGMAYLVMRYSFKINVLLKVFLGGIFIAIPVFLFVFPEARATKEIPVMGRVANYWASSDSFITYFLGALIFTIIITKNETLTNWNKFKSILNKKKYLDIEVLFILTLAGAIGALFVTANMQDVYSFFALQLYISIVFLAFFLQLNFDLFRASNKIKWIFLVSIIILSIISRPDILNSAVRVIHIKREFSELTGQQKILKEYVNELFKLDKEKNKKNKCIYIPHSESWYYNSQHWNLGSSLITPAISGIALIGGISEKLLNSDDNYYGLVHYQKQKHLPIKSINDAKKTAIEKGYKELIEYKVVDGKLFEERYLLGSK